MFQALAPRSCPLAAPAWQARLQAYLRRVERTPGTVATAAITLARRPESEISTVKVIQAVPLTDWVCTPITLVLSRAKTS